MRAQINDEENYMTQYEKQVIIDQEIDKLLADLPEYRRERPEDKYSLEPITEDEQGKFIRGQMGPLVLPSAGKKLRSASRRKRPSTIPPRKPPELRSMLFEFTIMEFLNGECVDTEVFPTETEFVTIIIPDSPFSLKIPVEKLREFLRKSLANGNPGYVTFEKGRTKFKMAIEINPQVLLDNKIATIY